MKFFWLKKKNKKKKEEFFSIRVKRGRSQASNPVPSALKVTRYCMFENNRKDLTIIHSLIHSFIHAVDSIKPSDHKPVGSKRKEKDWKVNTSCRTVLQTH